jgi:gamma-glutamyltranspeptidase/glutathione hydrolase
MLQVMLNVYEFGMSAQTAVEQSRFASYKFPKSFAPLQY